jgi:hypothetical protein
MADDIDRPPKPIYRVEESQQLYRNLQPSDVKSLLGGANPQDPFADQIHVVADTPPALPRPSPDTPDTGVPPSGSGDDGGTGD